MESCSRGSSIEEKLGTLDQMFTTVTILRDLGYDDVLSGTYLSRLQGVTCWKILILCVVIFYSKSQKKMFGCYSCYSDIHRLTRSLQQLEGRKKMEKR